MPRLGLLRGTNNEKLPSTQHRSQRPGPPDRAASPRTPAQDAGALHAGCSHRERCPVRAGSPTARPGAHRVHSPRPPPFTRPAGRSAPPAALTAFFFCTILSIFLAMRTTSSSMAPAGIHRAQPVRDGMWAKVGQRRQEDASSGSRAARHSRPGPRPFTQIQPAAAAAAARWLHPRREHQSSSARSCRRYQPKADRWEGPARRR